MLPCPFTGISAIAVIGPAFTPGWPRSHVLFFRIYLCHARLESVRLSWHVGQVGNLPKFWQVTNLPHIGTCGVDVTPYCITLRKADGLFTGVLYVAMAGGPQAGLTVQDQQLHTADPT